MKLEENHEIVGMLQKVESNEQHIKLYFILHKNYEIPIGTLLEGKLQSLVGSRIGVFNAGEGVFKLRKVNKK